MLNLTRFLRSDEDFSFLIVSPHSSQGGRFFEAYPEILKHPQIQDKLDLFQNYVKMESDYGAQDLSLSIAQNLRELGYGSIVCELDYPRGILDGGREPDHCLRRALPEELLKTYQDEWVGLHLKSLATIEEFYKKLNQNHGILLDIHTMASFSPMKNGVEHTFKEGIDHLESYCQQFLDASKNKEALRQLDLISQDGDGIEVGYPPLKNAFKAELAAAGIDYVENHPYVAESAFLMRRHMVSARGLAIDVPKHMLAKIHSPSELHLYDMELDHEKIESLGLLFAKAAVKALLA